MGYFGLCGISFLLFLHTLSAQNLDCDFESGFCDWTFGSSSDRNWTRSQVKSASSGTGPVTGHTEANTNYYIYLYAKDFRDNTGLVQPGKCVLVSPDFATGQDGGCFLFWYHMHGRGVGNLTMSTSKGGTSTVQFNIAGEEGNEWKCGAVSLNADQVNVKLEVTATSGANVQGDIALDDFKYYNQECASGCSDINPVPTTSGTTSDTASSVPESSTNVAFSATSETTTSQPAPDDTWILYVALVPIGILIIGGIIAFILYKKRKKPKSANEYDITDWGRGEPEPEEESPIGEEYVELDELAMDKDVDDGYTYPAENGEIPTNNNYPNGMPNENTKASYMKMRTTMREASVKDDDTASVHSYVDALPSPKSISEPFGSPQGAISGVSNAGFNSDSETARLSREGSENKLQTGKTNGGFDPVESGQRLSVHQRPEVNSRASPVPDYDKDDVGPPPPKCGPTFAYIRPM